MAYKAVFNDNSLCHYNKNHDPKNGRFTFKKAWEEIDTSVAKGYDIAEKTVRGAVKGIKGEFKKSPTSPTTNKVSKVEYKKDVEKSVKKPPEAFKTPDLDRKSKIIEPIIDKVIKISKLPWLRNNDDPVEKWGKEYAKACDIGLKALDKTHLREAYDKEIGITNGDRSWFFFEDQTFGMPQIAYLASIGKTKNEIKNIIDINKDLERANNDYHSQYSILKERDEYDKAYENRPYKSDWYLYEGYRDGGDDEYIDACVEIAKELEHSGINNIKSKIYRRRPIMTYKAVFNDNSLCHYNKNHSSKNGQFISGDGDGDGIANDHAHRSEKSDDGQKHMSLKEARNIRNAGVAQLVTGAAGQTVATLMANHTDSMVPSYIMSAASIPMIVFGTVNTVRGAVSAGKAKRRGIYE